MVTTKQNNFSIATVGINYDYDPNVYMGYSTQCSSGTAWTDTNITQNQESSAPYGIEFTAEASTPREAWLTTDFTPAISVDSLPFFEFGAYDDWTITGTVSIDAKREDNSTYYEIASSISPLSTGESILIDMRDQASLVGQSIDNFRFTFDGCSTGEEIFIGWIRIGAILYIPTVGSKQLQGKPFVVKHNIINRDGQVLQIISRESRSFTQRGRWYEITGGQTKLDVYEMIEAILSGQTNTGDPAYYEDDTHSIKGFINIIPTEIPANHIQLRFDVTEETNP
jgi:hypothetical protein